MYKVTIVNDGIETIIHGANVNGLKLATGIVKKEINAIDSFNFSFYMGNPGYGKIKPLKTLIRILNMKTGKYEFEGRVLGPSESMDDSGLHSAAYDCEGELGYLHDSMQRHLKFRGSPEDLLKTIIEYHNLQVETYKQFQVGQVTVTDPNNYMYLYLSAEKDTFDTIKENLIDKLGGELQIRKENGVRFLDYLVSIGEEKSTEIRIAKNLISISRDIDPTQIITRLTPLGARIESENKSDTDASEARLTIESVNNGKPYIDSPALIAEFGIQGGSVTWDDVTQASNLLSKGKAFFSTQTTALIQYQLSALDLFLIGLDIDQFDVGNSYPVINPIMAINERLRVVGKQLDINNPHNAALTIGDKFKTLNEYQSEMNASAKRITELQITVNRQMQTIGSLKTELESVNAAVTSVQQSISESDIPGLQQAVNDLQSAVNDLNQTVDGIPTYNLATSTADGLMSKDDKGKLDLITVLSTIDLDALKAKLDLITVIKAVDLDDLVNRVVALEGGTA
ncbi:phage tail spike protein [Heyndrickxia acidiproducens]|uniref:phage tail spike protein n=1 Tax=Heyndrickxia acidiproducens TaxID=1121084 RepID=UPI00036C2E88|nr:phage tail spike protein [Heyndrickxia acidiproducens]